MNLLNKIIITGIAIFPFLVIRKMTPILQIKQLQLLKSQQQYQRNFYLMQLKLKLLETLTGF
jgi:hypothetical protein